MSVCNRLLKPFLLISEIKTIFNTKNNKLYIFIGDGVMPFRLKPLHVNAHNNVTEMAFLLFSQNTIDNINSDKTIIQIAF